MDIVVGAKKSGSTGQISGVYLKDCQRKVIEFMPLGEFKLYTNDKPVQEVMQYVNFIRQMGEADAEVSGEDITLVTDSAPVVTASYDFGTRTLSGLKVVEMPNEFAEEDCTPVVTEENQRSGLAVGELMTFVQHNSGCVVLNGVLVPSMHMIYRCSEDGSFSAQGEKIGTYEVSQLDYIAVYEVTNGLSGFITSYKGEYFLVPMFLKADYEESQYIPIGIQGSGKQALCTVAYLETHGGEPVSVGPCLCKAHAGTMRERLIAQSAFPCFSYNSYNNLYSSNILTKGSMDSICKVQGVADRTGKGKAWLLTGIMDYNKIPDWTEEDLELFRITHTKSVSKTKGRKR